MLSTRQLSCKSYHQDLMAKLSLEIIAPSGRYSCYFQKHSALLKQQALQDFLYTFLALLEPYVLQFRQVTFQ